ncbi:phage/plasmid primase, P4 family [Intrasporangium sp. YIM S08009]|uniref:DNA primase family protein n=1 Tax=Intrasporangium zincisolvens TaxID=3080018 RepID=UPI002B05E3CF|nr:phage/plasmid primase, P4 family [Intrasporangium sp. YIM S08009]
MQVTDSSVEAGPVHVSDGRRVAVDPDAVRNWVRRVYDGLPGVLCVHHADRAGKFDGGGGACATELELLERVTHLDRAGAQSIYLRTSTLAVPPAPGNRGSAADSLALPGLWADVDFGSLGHAHDPAMHGGLTLPPDADEARRMVEVSGLPEPTLWVNSGGGLYPWWLFDEPVALDADTRPRVDRLSRDLQFVLGRSAAELGYHYGTGVGDLARVLRLPGTINRKAGEERPCFVADDTGPQYHLTEVQAAVSDLAPARSGTAGASVSLTPRPTSARILGEAGPFDALAERCSFEDILLGAGWSACTNKHSSLVSACFTRPGDGVTNPCSAHVLVACPEVLIVWSEAAALPSGAGQRLTKGRLFAHLWHGGDESAAARDLAAALRGGPCTPAAQALLTAASQDRASTRKALACKDAAPTATRADDYFDRHDGLRVASLATDVAAEAGPFALGPGDTLWTYRDGVYVDEGDTAVRSSVVGLCGERFRDSHLRNVTHVLKAQHTHVRLPSGTEVPPDTFLNLPNGLLDWRQGLLRRHDPRVPSVHRIPTDWRPEARCPATDRFLRSLFGDDEQVLAFVDEVVAAVLYAGHPFHQRAIMLLGRGKNGKGALLTWLRSLVGDANVAEVKPQALDANRFASAQLYGKLANLAGDVAPTAFTNAERFKEITAGDIIDAERKYGQPFSFHPVATLIASFNEMPATADRSEGFFRRWLVLEFPHRFVDESEATGAEDERIRDATVTARVTTPQERSGYLNRAVAGLRRLHERGDFLPPPSVTRATERFREHADPVVSFLTEAYSADRDGFTLRSQLKREYDWYCEQNGTKPLSAGKLYEHLPHAAAAALGSSIHPHKRGGERGFLGLQRRTDE